MGQLNTSNPEETHTCAVVAPTHAGEQAGRQAGRQALTLAVDPIIFPRPSVDAAVRVGVGALPVPLPVHPVALEALRVRVHGLSGWWSAINQERHARSVRGGNTRTHLSPAVQRAVEDGAAVRGDHPSPAGWLAGWLPMLELGDRSIDWMERSGVCCCWLSGDPSEAGSSGGSEMKQQTIARLVVPVVQVCGVRVYVCIDA
jgi:hypothetical protein